MQRKFKLLMAILVLSIGVFSIFTLNNQEDQAQAQVPSYTVGYDLSKKDTIFGTMSDDEISATLSEKMDELKEAARKGKEDKLIKELRQKGFIVTESNPIFIDLDPDKRSEIFGTMSDDEIYAALFEKMDELRDQGLEGSLEDALEALEQEIKP